MRGCSLIVLVGVRVGLVAVVPFLGSRRRQVSRRAELRALGFIGGQRGFGALGNELAQHAREMISKRTIDALTAKKARGAVLGTPSNMTPAAIAKSLGIRQENARTNQQNQQAARLGGLLHAQGHTLQQIAKELNDGGYRTQRGQLFFSMSVQRLLQRQA